MSLIRITDPDEIKTGHVLMLGLVILGLAGNCLLTSAGKPTVLHDGALEWREDSVLLAIVEILDLNYAQPTPNGTAIKALVHGTCAAIGLLIAGLGVYLASRSPDAVSDSDTVIDIDKVAAGTTDAGGKKHLDPILTSQALLAMFVGWSFLSSLWSHAGDVALAGSILLAGQAAWAFALGFGLNRASGRYAGYILTAVLLVTAALAIAYHGERNPTLRASYPIGNPTFLAACLVVGLLVAAAIGIGGVCDRRRIGRCVGKAAFALIALVGIGYGFFLSRSMGAAVGMAVGAFAIPFLAGGKRTRIVVVGLLLVATAIGGPYLYHQRSEARTTGRDSSMRLRLYSWSYALDLIQQRPIGGHGQGGYAMRADALAVTDVESDPQALEARVSHAHNEWLETAADLGGVGLALIASAIGLTLLGGARSLSRMPLASTRWMMIGLLSALVAVVVSEFFGVALRIEGLPMIYFTLIGLIWALSRAQPPALIASLPSRPWTARLIAAAAVIVALLLADFSRRDFAAARAQYDTTAAEDAQDWDRAVGLARRAATDRLSPQRRYVATGRWAATHLNAADTYRNRFARRVEMLQQSPAPQPALEQLAMEDRQKCLVHAAEGMAVLREFQRIAPGDSASGWVESTLHDIQAGFAMLDGRSEVANAHRMAAIQALASQLDRRPFNADLAIQFVVTAQGTMPLADALDVLARPLRLQRPPSIYLEMLWQMSQHPDYAAWVDGLVAAAESARTQPSESRWPQRWIPEKLRLASIAAFSATDYSRAAHYLQTATRLYPTLTRRATLAEASSHAELAESLFFARPDQPQPAIDAAQEAVRLAPNSQPGRALVDALVTRLMAYRLADGQEEVVRERLLPRVTRGGRSPEAVLSDAYVSLAFGVFDFAVANMPEAIESWSRRALELAPDSATSWFLAADLAVHRRDESATLSAIEEIRRCNGDKGDLFALLSQAHEAMPESQSIAEQRQALANELGVTTQPATMPAP